jgi:hypothetical protein
MFRTRLLAVILVLPALLLSCSGKDGAMGPNGADGANGRDGNANVIAFEFGTRTTTTGHFTYTFPASPGFIDSSLVLGYSRVEGFASWYPVPGLGADARYMTRSLWYQSQGSPPQFTYLVNLSTPDGSADYDTSTTFTQFKIIIVPASVIIPITSRGLLSLSDYNAVAEYLNLSE